MLTCCKKWTCHFCLLS